MIPVVSIVGSSNSGKTTLIEKIIPELKRKGYKVGVIKHDAHHFDIDYEGKDTWRMSEAGADEVAISSKNKMAMIKMVENEESLDALVDWLFNDVDIVITEGYKADNKPKIEVVRYKKLLTTPSDNLIAVIDNVPEGISFSMPLGYDNIYRFNMKDVEIITSFLENRFLRSNKYVVIGAHE